MESLEWKCKSSGTIASRSWKEMKLSSFCFVGARCVSILCLLNKTYILLQINFEQSDSKLVPDPHSLI